MADLSGLDEEFTELKKLNQDVLENPDDYETWSKLIAGVETLEGGLNRNSSPQAIAATREIFDRFLSKFPLFFGYWKKYAELEFSIAGTESSEMIYERGLACVPYSVDLWTSYCGFKVDTCHDAEIIRSLFESGARLVGIDMQSSPFWDKYIEFEERQEDPQQKRIFAILERIVHLANHQFQRYFGRFSQVALSQPVEDLLTPDVLEQFRADIIANEFPNGKPSAEELERSLRERIYALHLEIYNRTQTETTKRVALEGGIVRPYFHVEELDEPQLVAWRKYLDFEEVEGDYSRTLALYERCVTSCALYDEFWLRYTRWMYAQPGKEQEVRHIYQRASAVYVPISRPAVRLNWALFEENMGYMQMAEGIYESMLMINKGHFETIVAWANMQRRQGGIDAAISVYKAQLAGEECSMLTKGKLVAKWAQLLWKIKGDVGEARQVFAKNAHWYMGVPGFWIDYFNFEMEQPTSSETERTQYSRIKHVIEEIRKKGQLPPSIVKDLVHEYMAYLLERGTKVAVEEYLELDKEVNGPFSVQSTLKAKLAEDGKESSTHRRMVLENGHPGVEINEAAIRKGENPYTKYYQQQGETTGSNGQPQSMRF